MPFNSKALRRRAGARDGILTVVCAPMNSSIVDVTADAALWICPPDRAYELIRVLSAFTTAGGAGASCNLLKCTGTQAPVGGAAAIASLIGLTGAANTVVDSALHATIANRQFGPEDRLCANFSGTLSPLAGLLLEFQFMPIQLIGDNLYTSDSEQV